MIENSKLEQQIEKHKIIEEKIKPTDYSLAENWIHIPKDQREPVDVFYLYPTIYIPKSEDDPLICDINNLVMRKRGPRIFLKQATAFETVGNIYAPFYRQMTADYLTNMTREDMMEVESREPKADAFAALDYYFKHYNQGKPYILAGHSQGAMMIYLILEEYMKNHPEYYQNMVAAYMQGFAPEQEWFLKNNHLKPAAGADDVGVVIAWNTEGVGNRNTKSLLFSSDSICINPLNWRTDDRYAGVDENLGCCIKNENREYVVVKGFADAQIDLNRKSLVVRSVDSEQFSAKYPFDQLFGPESYHMWDVNFWYMNIRENARIRVRNFLEQRK